MPVYFRNTSHDIMIGKDPIEKMGGDKLTYSMYGENIPVVLEDDEYIVKIKNIEINTIWYLTSKGNLYGCGSNQYGQQGSGDTTRVTKFTKRAENVKDFYIATVGTTVYSTWYIDNNDDLYGCGYNYYGQQGSGDKTNVLTFTKRAENVRKVQSSDYATFYITNNDELYGCGLQQQQGSGNSSGDVLTFTKRAENVKDVYLNKYTTFYITNNDELWVCGMGSCSGTISSTTFTRVSSKIKKFACSYNASWYIASNGNLYGCGDNRYGQQSCNGWGPGKTVDKFTLRASNATDVFVTDTSTFYVYSSLSLYACGYNNYGQLGIKNKTNTTIVTPFAISTSWNEGYQLFTNSTNTTTYRFIPSSGQVYAVGRNNYGQLGTGDTSDIKDGYWEILASGVDYFTYDSLATWYIKDGKLYGCGYNGYGNQSDGTTTNVTRFSKRAENVREVYTMHGMTWYIDNENRLYACGSNQYKLVGSDNKILTFTKIKLPKE